MKLKVLSLLISAFGFVFVSSAMAQQFTVSGTVTASDDGNPLPNVTVIYQGTNIGTATDVKGHYELDVPSGNGTLVFSSIGFKKKEVPINGRHAIDVELSTDVAKLNDVVVVGYGTQVRRDIVGSVSSVPSESLTELHTTTIDKALQGKTAGVQVTSTSGVLGAPVSVRVRGTTSINASSQPLYVIDGVPVVSNEIGATMGVGGEGGINPLINLDTDDIKSIEVLKDASAAAIYGSRGANGVVLITTKDGTPGHTEINVGFSTGYSEPTKKYDLLTGPEYLDMYNYKTGGNLSTDTFGASTDWADLVTQNGSVQNYRANVSGGTEQTQFYISSSYQNEEGFARPNELEKFNARAKVNHSFNDKLDVGLSVAPSRSVNNRIATSNQVAAPYTFAALEPPIIPQFYPNGDINDARDPSRAPGNAFAAFGGTPYSNISGNVTKSITTQLIAQGNVSYDFIPALTLKTDLSVQYLQNLEKGRSLTYSTDGYPNGSGSARNEQFLNYSWRNTLKYTNDWGNHSITALVGAAFQKNEDTFINVFGDTFLSNQLLNLNSAANITGGGGFGTSYAFQNNLARVSYSFKDRYLITLTGSYNGSSRFGKDERYGFFPAAALGWIISDEPFTSDMDWLSFLKLRGSYGVTGNANIDNFAQLALLQGGQNYAGNPGVAINQLASPKLRWEKTAQLDLGLEYGFFNNRLRGSFGYYRKRTTNLLLDVPVSNTNGFTDFTKNTGEVLNRGFEFEVNANILSGDVNWSVHGNISTLHNEVIDLPAGEFNISENLVREGEPIGAFYVVEYKGVDPNNGDALFADGNGGTTNNYNAAPRKVILAALVPVSHIRVLMLHLTFNSLLVIKYTGATVHSWQPI
jgi:TonB-linked SusC/RagA family outer membrane protein